MRILVTGGAGFIGSHLSERLLRDGHEVICLDNFFTGRRENVSHLLDNRSFELLRHDVIEPILLEIDQIYNLACPASPIHYQYNPVKTVKTSVMGMINMLGLAKRVHARILQASTSEVYGDPEIHPQPESYWGNVNPIGVRSCFSADTEVLTKEGWKAFPEVTTNDEIATLTKAHTVEYHHPHEVIKQRYIGELIHFQNHNCDLLVTPNHKMYARVRGKEAFELIPAFASINWSRAQMLKVADFEAEEQEWFHLPFDEDARKFAKFSFIEKLKMDDWAEFFGYYITEGCVSKRVGNYRILIAQDPRSNAENYEKIRACIERLPFNFVDSFDHKLTDKRKEKPVYSTHILNRFNQRFITPSYPKRSIQFYDGYVYCVDVPNHVIFVRRNGKALFCGNCYDEGKRIAETLMMDYHRQNKVDIRIARIFNTYGTRMLENDGRVVSNFIVQALRGDQLTIYGTGEQTRSFCYVDDLVEGLVLLMNADGIHDPVNLGNPGEFTIKELAEEVKRICGSNVDIKYLPLPQDDPRQRKPDITRAQQLLGWNPLIPLREGLEKTVAYFAERINGRAKSSSN